MPQTHSIPRWPALALLAVLALQVTLVLGRSINWDEFYHYSLLQKLAAGTLSEPLQTAYTHLFQWVLALPGTGIDHIIAIRWIMLGTELLTLAAIIGVASHFASRSAAWLCALSYAGAGYVFQHATSFRFDGPAAALLMSAAWLMLRPRLSPAVILGSGLMIGAAALLTIKVVLYAPVFAGIAWLRWKEDGRKPAQVLRFAATGLVAAITFAALYALHATHLPKPESVSSGALLGQANGTLFGLGLPPYWQHHLKGAAIAPLLTLMILVLPRAVYRAARPAAEKVALISLALPLTTLLFYHNTAPYFFVFMLAPVCAALGPVLDRALTRYSEALIAAALGATAVAVWAIEQPEPLERQRQLIAAADAIFPDRPAYFDSCAMLGTFPKANPFMTRVGLALYQQGAYPSMTATMEHRVVPLVVADDPLLERALTGSDPVRELLPEDLAALRGSFVQLWGPFWVAGVVVSAPRDFQMLIPGAYRVEGGDMLLDGKLLASGVTVDLSRGAHRATPAAGKPRLIWAKAGAAPANPPPPQPWFADF